MYTDITPRQLDFLQGLHDLVSAAQGPVHYTQVADHLGVNRYSAYDMLKVLEAKHLVASDYVLAASKDGPGRSRIVFFPTTRGVDLLRSHQSIDAPPASTAEEWADFKEGILRRLREARKAGSRDLLADLVSRLPERRRPLHYCAQMVSALVLNLERMQNKVAAVSPFDALDALTANDEESVSVLAGLSLGSAMVADERADPSIVQQLLAQMHDFQDQVHGLSHDSQERLRAFLREAVRVFATSAAAPTVFPLPRSRDSRGRSS